MAGTEMTSVVARSTVHDPAQAVEELRAQLGDEPGAALVYFVSPKIDFAIFAELFHKAMGTPSIGCTTAGEVCSALGHCEDGIVATIIRSPSFGFETTLIEDATHFDAVRAEEEISPMLEGDDPAFGIVLIDGLSAAEEQVCASLANALRGVPFVGGSAGDDLNFQNTWVAVDGRVAQNAAAFAVVRTSHPFRVFQAHHFEPSAERLIITGAVPSERRVTEINGEPAAEGYANALGLTVDQLTPEVLAERPVMLSIGGEYYIRSIQKVNDDGSLTFYCAIDEGLVVRIANGGDLPDVLEQQLDGLNTDMGDIGLIIGYDCIQRRLELLNRGQRERVHEVIRGYPMIGFSTYGEQLNGLHMNQTLTGVAIGKAA